MITAVEDTAIEREHHSASSRAKRAQDASPRSDRPKKSSRRPRRILGLWARLTLLVLFIGVLGLAIFGLVTKAIRPYREAGAQKGQMTVARREIAEVDQQNADLRRRIAYLQTDDGKITEARKMGFVKPGEIPIVVEGQPPSGMTPAFAPATPPSPPATAVRHGRSKARRFWQRLTGH